MCEGSRQVSPAIGLAGLRFFVKQPVGPGWALVGDSGLHLDPTPGLGITDAWLSASAYFAGAAILTAPELRIRWPRDSRPAFTPANSSGMVNGLPTGLPERSMRMAAKCPAFTSTASTPLPRSSSIGGVVVLGSFHEASRYQRWRSGWKETS